MINLIGWPILIGIFYLAWKSDKNNLIKDYRKAVKDRSEYGTLDGYRDHLYEYLRKNDKDFDSFDKEIERLVHERSSKETEERDKERESHKIKREKELYKRITDLQNLGFSLENIYNRLVYSETNLFGYRHKELIDMVEKAKKERS